MDGRALILEEIRIADPIACIKELRAAGLIQPQERYQRLLSIRDVFPVRDDGICACGCEKPLLGRIDKRRRWATGECGAAANRAMSILHSQTDSIGYYLRMMHGGKCAACEGHGPYEVDHIIEIRDGGGGLWIENFQLLCHDCHVAKTTFSRRKRKALDAADGQHEIGL